MTGYLDGFCVVAMSFASSRLFAMLSISAASTRPAFPFSPARVALDVDCRLDDPMIASVFSSNHGRIFPLHCFRFPPESSGQDIPAYQGAAMSLSRPPVRLDSLRCP